jgi:hypothetical protein
LEFAEELPERPAAGCDSERLPDLLAEFPVRLPTGLEPERPLRLAAGFFLFFVGAVFLGDVLSALFWGVG